LPGAVAKVFGDWLSRHFPERREKVLSRIRSMRGGSLNDPRFGSRMRGEGPIAEHIAQLFHISRRRAGIPDRFPGLSVAAFRVPGDQPTLFD
ncbi:MAG: radical SAM protein, partial [Rubrobacteraceae bacterium]|nr:radical SAM protein [Rubrobacteraceae bacterium]